MSQRQLLQRSRRCAGKDRDLASAVQLAKGPEQSGLDSHPSLSIAVLTKFTAERLIDEAYHRQTPRPAFCVQSFCSHFHALCTALFTPCRLAPTKGGGLDGKEIRELALLRTFSDGLPKK